MADQNFTTEELESEEWRKCPFSNNRYSVSNLGRVRSEVHNQKPWRPPVIINPRMRKGYYVVNINLGGHKNRVTKPVHALVAIAFIGPRPEGHEINHKDGKRTNNRLTNLEFVTPSGNMQHAYQMGLCKPVPGSGIPRRFNLEQIQGIRLACTAGESYAAVGRRYGVSDRTISSVVRHLGAYSHC